MPSILGRVLPVTALAALALTQSGCMALGISRYFHERAPVCRQGYVAQAAVFPRNDLEWISAQAPELIVGFFLSEAYCAHPGVSRGKELAQGTLNPIALQDAIWSAKDKYEEPEVKDLLEEFYWQVRTFGQS